MLTKIGRMLTGADTGLCYALSMTDKPHWPKAPDGTKTRDAVCVVCGLPIRAKRLYITEQGVKVTWKHV